jgi:hypothetical protein
MSEINKRNRAIAARLTSDRDQAIAFIRENQQMLAIYSVTHEDELVRYIANFAISELNSCPDIAFEPKVEDGTG